MARNITKNRLRNMIRQYLVRNPQQVNIRRKDISDNIIKVDYVKDLTPPFQRQEDKDDNHDDDDSESQESNDASEESVENKKEEENNKASQQDSNGDNGSEDDNGSDYDEPEGDGQGGGILGLLAGLSGGEEGSDLGTLLSVVSEVAGNLSGGEGFDFNALITSAFGLFFGLLSQGEENPGEVIANYFLTSLDTITGGGAQNNGGFIGKFLSTLLKGVSAAEDESGESSEEGNGKVKMADSAGFFVSLLTSLSGEMSKGSSGGSSSPW